MNIRPSKPSPISEGQDGRGLFETVAAQHQAREVVNADEPLVLTNTGKAVYEAAVAARASFPIGDKA